MTGEQEEDHDREQAKTYDDAAKKIDWQGPSRIFDLLSPHTLPGQAVLDIGIGTGLGSEPLFRAGLRITGMDISGSMLAACRKKGVAECLVRHDLTIFPYPFGDKSFDHAISTGVFQFFSDLDGVFREIARILPEGGRFAFIVGDRSYEQPSEIIAGPEQTGTDTSVTMYCHTEGQISGWLEKNGFRLKQSVLFAIWMDERHTKEFPARAYLAQKDSIRN